MHTWKGLLLLMGAMAVAGSAEAKVQHLAQPCRARNILAGRIVRDPVSGDERLVFTNQNEQTHCELLFVDFRHNTGNVYSAPAGDGSWALAEVEGGRLVVGTYYDGVFMVFDMAKKAFTNVIPFPGEEYIWNIAVGKDGRVYGGTYPGGKLGALDVKTLKVEDLGNAAPPNLYLRHVSALPDGRILCHYIMDKPSVMIFDPDTKRSTPAPSPLNQVDQGVVWNGYFVSGSQAFGRDLSPVSPLPFPVPPGSEPWSVAQNLTSGKTLYLRQGSTLYRYRAGDSALALVSDLDLSGGEYRAAAENGDILVLRGQDYAVLRPGDKTLNLKRIPGESAPRPTHFLRVDPRGRVWGGPTFGQTVFRLDPNTGKYVNTGTVSNLGGEVYDAAFVGDSMYMVSYAGGEIIRYDVTKPWDQFNHKNPRTIATVAPKYIRPSGGIVLGPQGKLYSGWMARYGTYGGALAITDPKTGRTEVIDNPLGEQTIHGVAVDAEHVYLGTSLEANGLRFKPDEPAHFGVMDVTTHAIAYRKDFPGVQFIHSFGLDAALKRLAMIIDQRVAVFDTEKQRFVDGLQDAPPVTGYDGAAPGDGCYYYGSGNRVLALDLATGVVFTRAELPAKVDHLTATSDGTLYVSSGVDVYRVTR